MAGRLLRQLVRIGDPADIQATTYMLPWLATGGASTYSILWLRSCHLTSVNEGINNDDIDIHVCSQEGSGISLNFVVRL